MSALPYVVRFVIPTALAVLEDLAAELGHPAAGKLDRADGRATLIAIGLQESRFEHRCQIRGPARGFWQFEEGGGFHGVLGHNATHQLSTKVLAALQYPGAEFEALTHNDVLACCFARLLLWTHPEALPGQNEADAAWDYYESVWRPGKPHPETWLAFWHQAWVEVWRAQKTA
jgi:hypothetical protein